MTSLNTPQRKFSRISRISRIPERLNPNWLHQLVDDDHDEFYSTRSWSSSDEETDENPVTCDRCGRR